MRNWKLAVLAFAATLTATAAVAATPDYVGRGNEPGWSVRKNADGITFQQMGQADVKVTPLPHVRRVRGSQVYFAQVGGQPFRLEIAPRRCVDTMSGMTFPDTVQVRLGSTRFNGCGGDPSKVLRGGWRVTSINGKPIAKGTKPTIEFGEDGLVSGNSSCNRFFANYTLTGEGMTIAKPGSSMMFCEPQSTMDQEAAFLKVLSSVNKFEIGKKGELILHSGQSDSITARRK